MTVYFNDIAYDICAVAIFCVMSFTFLFPCNSLLPLDRRSVSIMSATLVYISRSFIFPHKPMDIIHAIDFDVLILLAAIMIINHIIVHLKETKKVISSIQKIVQQNPIKGFWLVSFAAFIVAPFLTNDGVCLLFVSLILNAFEDTSEPTTTTIEDGNSNEMAPMLTSKAEASAKSAKDSATLTNGQDISINIDANGKNAGSSNNSKLENGDAIYFLLTLACSSNIGSALTYTGNPQNMIVAQDALSVLPPMKFLLYMILPTTVVWLITTKWIEYCWTESKKSKNQVSFIKKIKNKLLGRKLNIKMYNNGNSSSDSSNTNDNHEVASSDDAKKTTAVNNPLFVNTNTANSNVLVSKSTCGLVITCDQSDNYEALNSDSSTRPMLGELKSPLSPRKRRQKARESVMGKVVHMISSPIPYIILILLAVMIVMIFVDVMSIAGLVCVTAMVMVVTLVLGNHWRGRELWEEISTDPDEIVTSEDKKESLNEFFENLFGSIDYSLLLIFLGTFIVVANIDSTGIPKQIWDGIVGKVPFKSFGSIVGISLFVLLSSQFLGNVAVVQLVKPNVASLDDDSKRFAWTIISFIATVGGNLTITGSAANIIVAEKASRLDPDSAIDFYNHYRVCFWITLLSCILGGLIITIIAEIEKAATA